MILNNVLIMANWEMLKNAVGEVIKPNGREEITGQVMQNVLFSIITQVGKNATFAGVATPGTAPGTPDGNVFYLAAIPGSYPNFGGAQVKDGELTFLRWSDGQWYKDYAKLQPVLIFDAKPTEGSKNPVYSGGVYHSMAELNAKIDMQKNEVDAARDKAIEDLNTRGQELVLIFNTQRVTPEMLSEETKQYINASGGGTINNLPDGEDLMTTGGDLPVLKFANKQYVPENYSGLARVYLRKNIVDGNNILSQDMMPVLTGKKTIYIIQYDYNLVSQTVTIPENCVLKFEGGSISNGTIVGNNTCIESCNNVIFKDCRIQGTFNVPEICSSWMYNADGFIKLKNIENLMSENIYNKVLINEDINITLPNSGVVCCDISSNTDVYINSTISLNNTEFGTYSIFRIDNKNNVSINNGHIIGYRGTRYDESFQYGMNINVRNSRNVKILNVISDNSLGDGVIISGKEKRSSFVVVENCSFNNNKRQGITLANCDNIYVNNCKFRNINGGSPSAGIDIEPDVAMNAIDINISNCVFENNDIGIILGCPVADVPNINGIENVYIDNCKIVYNCSENNKTLRYPFRIYNFDATHGTYIRNINITDVDINVTNYGILPNKYISLMIFNAQNININNVNINGGFSPLDIASFSKNINIRNSKFYGTNKIALGRGEVDNITMDACSFNVPLSYIPIGINGNLKIVESSFDWSDYNNHDGDKVTDLISIMNGENVIMTYNRFASNISPSSSKNISFVRVFKTKRLEMTNNRYESSSVFKYYRCMTLDNVEDVKVVNNYIDIKSINTVIYSPSQNSSYDIYLSNNTQYDKIIIGNFKSCFIKSNLEAGDVSMIPSNVVKGSSYYDTTNNKKLYWDGEWYDCQGNPYDAKTSGDKLARPKGVKPGFFYYDSTLKMPIWWTGGKWIKADGTDADAAIKEYQEKLVSGTNIKTINGETVLGKGDISVPKV